MHRGFFMLLSLLLIVGGCHSDDDGDSRSEDSRTVMFAVSESDELVGFFADAPGQFLSRVPLSGIVVDDAANPPFALSMDFSHANLELFLLYSDHRLYSVDLLEGEASLIGQALGELGDASIDIRSMDFDPVSHEIRLVDAQTGENYRISSSDATLIAQDTTLAYATGDSNEGSTIFAHGLSYQGPGPNGERTAYVMDQFADVLARLGSADDRGQSARLGQLTTIGEWSVAFEDGDLSVETERPIGYTVAGSTHVSEQTDLHRIDLSNAASVNLGRIGNESGRYVVLAFSVLPTMGMVTPSPSPGPTASPGPSPTPGPSASPSPSPSADPGGERGPLTQECIDRGTGAGFPEEQVVLFCETVFGTVEGA